MSHCPLSIVGVTDKLLHTSGFADFWPILNLVDLGERHVGDHCDRFGQSFCEFGSASLRGDWMPTADLVVVDQAPLGTGCGVSRLVMMFAVILLLGACTSMVDPPVDVEDPVQVFVLSEAIHTGIVLPPDPSASGNPDQYVEFGFGDWSYYALENDALYQAVDTVLWPTQGTLCRRTFGARDAEDLFAVALEIDLQPIIVSRDDAVQLRRRLQAEFDAARKSVIVNRDSNLKFVPTSYSYWLPYNCVDAAVDWLRELGCEASWCPIRYSLAVTGQSK